MTLIIPTIRAGSLAPVLRWSAERGLPVESLLREAGLGGLVSGDPNALAPVRNAAEFLRRLARQEGPDLFCRIGAGIDIGEIGALGGVVRARPTPRQALRAAAAFMPRHSTHEHFTITSKPDGLSVVDTWMIAFDPEALHLVQQYVAALIQALCSLTGIPAPLLARIEMTPHPTAGLEHLRPWLGPVEPAKTRRLLVVIRNEVADARMVLAAGAVARIPPDWLPLRDQGDFRTSIGWTILAMLGSNAVSIDSVAAAAGLSRRTFQRRLAAEGLDFSSLLDETRREAALLLLTSSALSMGDVAARLGYANASALTRAVRRWTGLPPQAVRQNARPENLAPKDKSIT